MNANELADILQENKFQVDEDGVMICVSHQALDEAITMLRHQQAEIEALKNAISDEVINAAIMYADLSGFGSHYSEGLSDGFEQARAILRKAQEK